MRFIKIALLSLGILLIVAIAAIIIFMMTFDINKFKPQIISEANKALHREVDFSKMGLHLSLRQGISLRLRDLVIADDPAIQEGEFLTAKDISVVIDIRDYIYRKEVNIASIMLDAVRINIIRQKDGRLNMESIAQPSGSALNETSRATAPSPVVLPMILVSSLKVRDGIVSYRDFSSQPAGEMNISDVDIAVNNISLAEPFPFMVDGTVLSAQQNIHLKGMVRIDPSTGELTLYECQGGTDLADISNEQISHSFPGIDSNRLPRGLSGKVNCSIDRIIAGPQGISPFNADVTLSDGAASLNGMAAPIENGQMLAIVKGSDLRLEKLSAGIGNGIAVVVGEVKDYAASQVFSAKINTANIKLEDLLAGDNTPAQLTGIIAGNMQLQGKGFSEQALNSCLSGYGIINTKNVVLKDINVLRMVLDKLAIIPNLGAKVQAKLPDNYRQKLLQDDTILHDADFPLALENGRLMVKHMVVSADEFSFRGSSYVGLDGGYSIEGTLTVPADLSGVIIASVSELQYLLNANNEISIPLKMSGRASEGMNLIVDANYVGKNLLINQGTQQLMRIIDKNIQGNDRQNSVSKEPVGNQEVTEAPDQIQNPQTTRDNNQITTEAVVSDVLSALFENKSN